MFGVGLVIRLLLCFCLSCVFVFLPGLMFYYSLCLVLYFFVGCLEVSLAARKCPDRLARFAGGVLILAFRIILFYFVPARAM